MNAVYLLTSVTGVAIVLLGLFAFAIYPKTKSDILRAENADLVQRVQTLERQRDEDHARIEHLEAENKSAWAHATGSDILEKFTAAWSDWRMTDHQQHEAHLHQHEKLAEALTEITSILVDIQHTTKDTNREVKK